MGVTNTRQEAGPCLCHGELASAVLASFLVLCFHAWAQSEGTPKDGAHISREEKALLNAFFEIENGTARKSHQKTLRELAEAKDAKYYTSWATALLAQHEREVGQGALKSLDILSPYLYSDEENGKALRKSIASHRSAAKKARAGAEEDPKFDLPSLEDINVHCGWCVVEAARALMVLRRYDDALAFLDAVGRASSDFSRVMAAEAGGDVHGMQGRWDDAHEWYASALKFYRAWLKAPTAGTPIDGQDALGRAGAALVLDKIQDAIVSRIELKLAEAQRLKEMELYGPGYYLYREAEFARRKAKDFRYAVAVCDEIVVHFPKTVYGDAAKCSKGLCLLELARMTPEEVSQAEIGRLDALMESDAPDQGKGRTDGAQDKAKGSSPEKLKRKDLDNRLKQIQEQKRRIPWWPKGEGGEPSDRTVTEVIDLERGDGKKGRTDEMHVGRKGQPGGYIRGEYEYRLFMETKEERIARRSQEAVKVACGEKAKAQALELLRSFIEEQYYGLYRGEAMLAIADCALELDFDVETARNGYAKAILWCQEIGKLDAAVAVFALPGQVRSVAAPPESMKAQDVWGNTNWAALREKCVFNRRTSPWYMAYLKFLAHTKYALCCYMKGNTEEAVKHVGIIPHVDEAERRSFETGWPNSYSRLKAEFEQGRMFATKEELSSFEGEARTAIMVADYYYEIEQWREAAKRYRDIDRTMRRKLSKNARAYLDFMLANSLRLVEKDRVGSLAYLHKFRDEYKDTPTWPRGMFALFNVYEYTAGYEDKALGVLKEVHNRMPDDKMGKRAYYHQGEYLYGKGRYNEAREIFEECLVRYEGTWLARGAGQYLERIGKTTASRSVERGGEEK